MLTRRVSLPKCISPSSSGAGKRTPATTPAKSDTATPQDRNSSDHSSGLTTPALSPTIVPCSPVKGDSSSKDTAIKVVIRVRPLSEKELLAKSPVVVSVSKTSVQVLNPVLFTDPTFLDAISTATRKCSVGNLPIALSSQAIAAATQAGELRQFHFDRCFGVDNAAANESEPFANAYDIDATTQRPNQELVFEEIGKDMITSAFQGFNCTVFAYGQTGSGKTHTMVGEKTTVRGKGVIPRVCEALFQGIDTRRAMENDVAKEMENATTAAVEAGLPLALSPPPAVPLTAVKKTVFAVQMSYCEIYKEKVHDLLDGATPNPSPVSSFSTMAPLGSPGGSSGSGTGTDSATRGKVLKVREHPITGPFVEGLSTRLVNSLDEITDEMALGDKLRTVAATLMNAVSSRSHAVFTLTLTQTTFDTVTNVPTVKSSKISLIDLAGSERANVSGTSGDRLKEGAMINKSLTTLGRVIAALSKASGNSNTERVPYRDSTLTWLLKESLGGNAKTTMIAMVSPAAENYEETMSTLRYAESAKKVMNRAVVNEDPNARVIRQLRDEIQQLKNQLFTREKEAFYLAENLKDSAQLPPSVQDRDEFYHAMQDEMESYKSQVCALRDQQVEQQEQLQKASRVWRLHSELPSLLTTKPLFSLGAHDDVVMYTLSEGVSLVGSQAPPQEQQQQKQPSLSQDTENITPSPVEAKSPRRLGRSGSWAGSFLKRRKSSAASGALVDGEPLASTSDAASGGDSTSKSPRSPKAMVLGDEPTNYLWLPNTVTNTNTNSAADGQSEEMNVTATHGVLARHAVWIVHSRLVPSPQAAAGEPDIEDEIEYVVELQPFTEDAVVVVNGNRVAQDARTRVVHGDVVGFGGGGGEDGQYQFRLHVPQIAARLAAMEKAKPLPPAERLVLEEPVMRPSLDELVEEANGICDKWHLNMAFSTPPSTSSDFDHEQRQEQQQQSSGVLVKKKLGPKRFSIVQWSREILEEKVVFLRELAASLELTVHDPDEQAISTVIEDDEEEDNEDEHDDPKMGPKLSVARDADRVESERDDSRAMAASVSMDGRYSTMVETTTAPGNVASQAPPPALCVRLLGHARVYLSGVAGVQSDLQGGGGPQDQSMAIAVYDAQGIQIARLHCTLHRLENDASQHAAKELEASSSTGGGLVKRGMSFLSPRGSMTAAASSRASTTGGPPGQSSPLPLRTVRVHVVLERVEFIRSATSLSDQISLTLKKWGGSSTTSSGSGSSTSTTGAKPEASATDSSVESTAKVPGSQEDGGSLVFIVNHTMPVTTCAALDDYIAVEVWGFGDRVAITQSAASPSLSLPLSLPQAPQRIELFVSVDIEERDADGFFRPVAVKSDGTLRLHVNQPRRVVLRVTQADHRAFVLQDLCIARLSPPFLTKGASNLAMGDGKSTQSLLLPPSSIAMATTTGATTTTNDANSARLAATTELDELPTFQEWRRLFPRATAELDVSSRSLNVSLRWEHASAAGGPAVVEHCDGEDVRSVFRLAVAIQTSGSRVPIVISKSMVTKMSAMDVTSSQRLAREWEAARTAWWAKESFSRSYRLGTWYSVELCGPHNALSEEDGDAQKTPSTATTAAAGADATESVNTTAAGDQVLESPTTVALVNAHITGLRRLELCVAMERVRQEIMALYLRTRVSDEYPLTLERAQECFEQVLLGGRSSLPGPGEDGAITTTATTTQQSPPVIRVIQLDDGGLYLRHKSNREIFISIETGDVKELDNGNPPSQPSEHRIHFVSEPSTITGDATASSGEMAGFLMFSTAIQLDESAVAPLSSTMATSNPLSWAKNTLTNRLSWERRWFVLKRPFLYAYKSFAKKEQIGVLDIVKCQVVVPPSSSSSSSSSAGRRPSVPGLVSRRGSSKPDGSDSGFPFSFQLVSLSGSKCVVWSLQASTQAELRAWLVAIDPLKIEARKSVVASNSAQSQAEGGVAVATA